MKTAVVFWSGTGNTEMMAQNVAEGARQAGAEVSIFTASEFTPSKLDEFDCIAFGCPSMGDEQLEECEFEPMFTSCIPALQNKKTALFGSYGWGDGAWMRSWEDTCRSNGISLAADSVICCGAPDENAVSQLKELGAVLA